MSELTLFLVRIAYLAILWIFVLSAISVIRSDMFGARVPEAARGEGRRAGRAGRALFGQLQHLVRRHLALQHLRARQRQKLQAVLSFFHDLLGRVELQDFDQGHVAS